MCADVAPKDFSTTAASNSTVGGINVAEGSTAAQLNDAIRAVLAVIKTGDWGAAGIAADVIAESTSDTGVTIDGLLIKDGALPNLTLGDTVEVGTLRPTIKSTADTGWLMANGNTLGSAASGATQASDDYETLFTLLWNEISNTYAAVSGGRGASAAADWAANKTIAMPDMQNNMPIGAGDTYAAGETGGAATHTLTVDEMPEHGHDRSSNFTGRVGTTAWEPINYSAGAGANHSSELVGGGAAHNNLPPYLGTYWQIKY